jgi:hypothetical protein
MDFIAMYGGQLLTGAFTLLGILAGYKLKSFEEQGAKQNRLASTWGAIDAEIEICRGSAEEYIKHGAGTEPFVPQWRLPDVLLPSALHALLAEGDPTHAEVKAILQYHNEAQSLNRGMDLAQDSLTEGRQGAALSRTGLNTKKARRLAKDGEYYEPVRALIDEHLPRS